MVDSSETICCAMMLAESLLDVEFDFVRPRLLIYVVGAFFVYHYLTKQCGKNKLN